MNNKICDNCASYNDIESKVCTNCDKEINQNNAEKKINNDIIENQVNNKGINGNKLGAMSLILFFVVPLVSFIITMILPINISDNVTSILGFSPLAGIVTMIIGRNKYPHNKFLKVVMWCIIISIIICLILFILLVISCYLTCSG